MTRAVITTDFRVNNFDLLRICAAIQVVFQHSIFHLQLAVPAVARSALALFPGVPIFFVISGYLISASYERNSSLATYLRSRSLRIFPALWTCVLVTMLVATACGNVNFLNKHTLPWLLCQSVGLIYTPEFLKHFGIGSYNGSLWTIPIELQFYLLLPILYFFARRLKGSQGWFVAFFAAFTFIALASNVNAAGLNSAETIADKLIRYSFIPHFYMFLLGVVLQQFSVYRSRLIAGRGGYWLLGYLLFSYLIPNSVMSSLCSRILLGVCAISLAYTRPFAARRLLRGNDISYGVYVYHGLILNVLVEMKKLHDPLYLAITIIGACSLGCLSWLFVERPFLKKKTTSRPQAPFDNQPLAVELEQPWSTASATLEHLDLPQDQIQNAVI